MMERKLCVILGSEKSDESFQMVDQPYSQQLPEIGILAVDGNGPDSASLIIVTYERGGAFSIRSQRGSRIIIRGGKPRKPFINK
jgi:hypothetical protein